MIELSEEQRESIKKGRAVRVHENGREYVLLHPDVYDRLADGGYDDSPWDPENPLFGRRARPHRGICHVDRVALSTTLAASGSVVGQCGVDCLDLGTSCPRP